MITNEEYDLKSIVEMKKHHPCGKDNKLFEVVRLGADIKIKCCHCERTLMMPRPEFKKKIKKILISASDVEGQ